MKEGGTTSPTPLLLSRMTDSMAVLEEVACGWIRMTQILHRNGAKPIKAAVKCANKYDQIVRL